MHYKKLLGKGKKAIGLVLKELAAKSSNSSVSGKRGLKPFDWCFKNIAALVCLLHNHNTKKKFH